MSENRCYAATIGECDGGLTREHYISKSILEQLGRFSVTGLPWQSARPVAASAMTAWMLCKRHNEELSPLDTAASRLFSIIASVQAEQRTGEHEIDGDLIERWSLKALYGMLTSGNALRHDGVSVKSVPIAEGLAEDGRKRILPIIFAREPMPSAWGLHVSLSPRARLDHQFAIVPNTHPSGPEQGRVYAVTVQMMGLYLTTALTSVKSDHERIWYRPQVLDLDGMATLRLSWAGESTAEAVNLFRTKGSAIPGQTQT